MKPKRIARGVRKSAATALVLCLAFGSAACAQSSGNASDVVNQGYESGDGSVKQWPASARGAAVDLSGTDYAGESVTLSDYADRVVVLNTWYAACPPCRKEAPALVQTAQKYAEKIQIIGINSTDEGGAAKAFQRTFSIPYPSIQDTSGAATAALQGVVPIQAVPTTVVLDRQHRVAARVLGEVSAGTLAALIDDVLAESSPTAS
ncbi:TlpA family protein disulfide reductase [Rarobacter incanus]|uniref:Thiol-disulfide isomerase/thioredoxin n=1 Tax=Rarobacter incanus TaxID=153494 RepID=A0A542SRT6_9MICO|nr:TlpA disulfide reductase family protein [Rarobacter incanus]TQK76947.1 thiol-disulfide isomerase/thioredoxin [Rarobacter incanus]